jgi:cytochrome c biogenesis protein
VDAGGRLESAFPAALNPRVSLVGFTGNLGMNSGQAQSVYQLNTTGLTELPMQPRPLAAGQSMKLPDGLGTVTYLGYRQWVSLAITYDPGQLPALASGIAALAGLILSFLIRRRRMFVRAVAAADGSTRVTVGGLARSDAAGGFEAEFAMLTELLRADLDAGPVTVAESEAGGLAAPAEPDATADDAGHRASAEGE